MTVTRNDPESWMDPLWEAISVFEEMNETTGREDDIDDLKTIMHWLREDLGLCDEMESQQAKEKPEAKIKYVCETCGGGDVTRDARVRWNTDKQTWDLLEFMNDSDCVDCGLVDLTEQPITKPLDQEPSQ